MKEENEALETGQELEIKDSTDSISINGEFSTVGFWVRFLAVIIDSCITTLLFLPFMYLIDLLIFKKLGLSPIDKIFPQLIISYAFSFCYFGWFYRNKGATPGKMLMGIRVIHLATGENLTYLQTLIREPIGKTFSGIVLMIGYIMAGVRKDRRALHDFLAGTQVIEKK